MVKRDASNKRTVLIVGGGPAGVTCAETLRQNGFTGMSWHEIITPSHLIYLNLTPSLRPCRP